MPTYGYRCKSCGHEMEEFQSISDAPLVTCPKCGKDSLVRDIGGGAGLVFKGSGFYLTDYRKKSSSGDPAPKSEPPKKDKPPASPEKPPKK